MGSRRSFGAAVVDLFRVRSAALPKRPTLTLRVTPELGSLHAVSSVSELLADPLVSPGFAISIASSNHIEEDELIRRFAGRVGGVDLPPWADGTGGAMEFGVFMSRVGNVYYLPSFGALITPDGAVLKSSVAEALYLTPDLADLPGVTLVDGKAVMSLPENPRRIENAAIFMAWGGRFNYGHFVLDCLSALNTIVDQDVLSSYPIYSPPLTQWQRDLLSLMLGEEEASKIRELEDEIVLVKNAVFASPMDHFLHAPTLLLERVRERILSRLPATKPGPERLYLSRTQDHKRIMLNEVELETRLSKLGFEIIHADEFSVEEQLALFKTAKVVVGATGAGFANCIFCAPETKVFEIQPTNYTGIWTRGICNQLKLRWYGYFIQSPAEDQAALSAVERNPGSMFAWRMPIDEFIAFLSSNLD